MVFRTILQLTRWNIAVECVWICYNWDKSSQPVAGGNCPHCGVMFLAAPFEMRKRVLTLSLAKLRWNKKAGLEYIEVLFMLIHLMKMVTCYPRFWIAVLINFSDYIRLFLLHKTCRQVRMYKLYVGGLMSFASIVVFLFTLDISG